MRYNKIVGKISCILLLALAVRIYVSFFSGLQWHTADTTAYYNFADSLKSGCYKQPFMPPGYSFLVLALDHFGSRDIAMIIFNIAVSALACLLVYFISARITASRKLGLLAMAIMAVYPNNVNYVRYILSETPTMFFLSASACIIIFFQDRPWGIFLSGLALGIAGITRITCLPVIFFYLLVYLSGRRYAKLCGYLFSFLLPVVMVLGMNYYHTQRWFIASSLPLNFIISIESRSGNVYNDGVKDPRYQKIVDNNDLHGAWSAYFKALKDDPREWLVKRFLSIWELWGPYPAAEGRRSLPIQLLIGLRFILLALAVRGGYILARRNLSQFLILSGPVITITLLHTLSFSVPRYTHVVEPLAVCLALCAFSAGDRADVKTDI